MLNQLLDAIENYLNKQSTLKELETWLISHLQEILDSKDERAINKANQIDADIIEFGEGLIEENILNERFKSYLEAVFVNWSDTIHTINVHTESASKTIRTLLEDSGQVMDLHLVHVFG